LKAQIPDNSILKDEIEKNQLKKKKKTKLSHSMLTYYTYRYDNFIKNKLKKL
jgi:hypothetical protein